MEVVVTAGAIGRARLQSNHYHQQTNTKSCYRPEALTVAQPTVSKHWRKKITFHGLAYPKLTWGSSKFVSDHYQLLVTLERVAMPLISPLSWKLQEKIDYVLAVPLFSPATSENFSVLATTASITLFSVSWSWSAFTQHHVNSGELNWTELLSGLQTTLVQ